MAVFNLRAAIDERFAAAGERIIMLGRRLFRRMTVITGCAVSTTRMGMRGLKGTLGRPYWTGSLISQPIIESSIFRGGGSLRDVERAISDSEPALMDALRPIPWP